MEPQTETQIKVVEEQVPDRQLQREQEVNDRFEKIENQLKLQPTKAEFEAMLGGLAKQSDIEIFNVYVKRFTLGVQILEKSSKWTLFAIVTVGGIAAGILVIKTAFITALGFFGFIQLTK